MTGSSGQRSYQFKTLVSMTKKRYQCADHFRSMDRMENCIWLSILPTRTDISRSLWFLNRHRRRSISMSMGMRIRYWVEMFWNHWLDEFLLSFSISNKQTEKLREVAEGVEVFFILNESMDVDMTIWNWSTVVMNSIF